MASQEDYCRACRRGGGGGAEREEGAAEVSEEVGQLQKVAELAVLPSVLPSVLPGSGVKLRPQIRSSY